MNNYKNFILNQWSCDSTLIDDTTNKTTIAEQVSQVANDFFEQYDLSDYVYIEEYGTYYNYLNGFHYDPKTLLFYHVKSQCYYYYNDIDQKYEIIPIYSLNKYKWKDDSLKDRAENLLGKCFVQEFSEDHIIICQLLFELIDKCSIYFSKNIFNLNYSDNFFSSKSDDVLSKECKLKNGLEKFNVELYKNNLNEELIDSEDFRRKNEEENSKHPPCVRLIEITENDNLLHIITILGAKIGFGDNCTIPLKTSGNNRKLNKESILSINYNPDEVLYEMICFLKQNDIELLNLKFNQEKLLSHSIYNLKHNDNISYILNNFCHCLNFHIHNGTNTCLGCEPGLITKKEKKIYLPESLEFQRRHILQQIKNEYGIKQNNEKKFYNKKKKKKLEDSDSNNIYSKCFAKPKSGNTADSVILKKNINDFYTENQNLNFENKGFKILNNMGWTKGKGLGKNEQGIQEPVNLKMKTTFNIDKNIKINTISKKNITISKMKQRFYNS